MAGEGNELSLGDLVTLTRGTTYQSALLGQPGPVLLGLASIKRNGGFRDDNLKTYGGDCPAKLTLRPGDIFVSLKDVTQAADLLGAVARVPPHIHAGRVTQDTVKLTFTRDDVPSRYIYWLLRTPVYREYCRAHAIGTTNLALPREDFLAFPIPRPKEREMSLVDVLDALDSKIELNRRMNATLEAMARALFQSWFVDFDPIRAKLDGRPPAALDPATAELFPASFQDSELGHIPKGWEVTSMGDLVDVVKGRSYRSEELAESKTALVTLKSFLRGGGYRADGLKPFTGEYKPNQKVSVGDLVVAFTDVTQAADVIGKPALVRSDERFDTLVASLDVGIVRPKSDRVSIPFLYCLFLSEAFQAHTYSHATGTTVLHLSPTAIPSFQCVIPSRELAAAFARSAEPLFRLIDENAKQSRTLATLRDTLLPKLLSGELGVAETGNFIQTAD